MSSFWHFFFLLSKKYENKPKTGNKMWQKYKEKQKNWNALMHSVRHLSAIRSLTVVERDTQIK